MSNKVIVHKNRTNVITLDLGIDITGDTISSEIRTQPEHTSTLIATWGVSVTDAANGLVTLTLDNNITEDITVDSGYMDVKRVSGGEPLTVFDKPLEVSFRGTVTA